MLSPEDCMIIKKKQKKNPQNNPIIVIFKKFKSRCLDNNPCL